MDRLALSCAVVSIWSMVRPSSRSSMGEGKESFEYSAVFI